VEVREGGIVYLADLWEGHKTGAYLDQQANRVAAEPLARGRCLDAFAYQGLFALHLARVGQEVVAVESSGPALERLAKNRERNGLSNLAPVKANVFDHLAELDRAGERFDTVVLDPPPFAKSRKDTDAARKGYKQLNLRAIRLLNPGGRLFTYSCSYNVSPAAFLETIRDAAADAGREMRVLRVETQSPDHPVLLAMPETHYLKGLVLEVH
jgi:23S rRNA (cytosine1962-C5)-methyltransferase